MVSYAGGVLSSYKKYMINYIEKYFCGSQFSFPLQEACSKANISLDAHQLKALKRIREKITNKTYKMVPNFCLCGHKGNEIIITEKDRFNLSFDFKLCKKCSLIRTDPVFDHRSLLDFYRDDFSLLHRGKVDAIDKHFLKMLPRGESFICLLKELSIIDNIENVLEVGCSAGGNLYPFSEIGKKVEGYDYDLYYLQYGRSLGMNLNEGDFYENIKLESQDLVILSHVLEHFIDPVKEVNKILEKVKEHGYFLVEVPGVLDIHRSVIYPEQYFQNDHIYSFNEEYLKVFFARLGLKILYSDEVCRFILEKPRGWKSVQIKNIYSDSLFKKYEVVEQYIKKTCFLNKYFPIKNIKRKIGSFLRRKGVLKWKIKIKK
ncbi:hypothetical protein MNBD_UNCLBAC01-519 [hydrothermal vent metagenome]|uniref:Uncharacterized protein n=1 Tax=hydrothermal vent metagenome TaxID=652676 RepID=A0A3B1D0S7_9ZZZZ